MQTSKHVFRDNCTTANILLGLRARLTHINGALNTPVYLADNCCTHGRLACCRLSCAVVQSCTVKQISMCLWVGVCACVGGVGRGGVGVAWYRSTALLRKGIRVFCPAEHVRCYRHNMYKSVHTHR